MKWFALPFMISAVSAAAAILGIDYGTEFVKSSLVAPNAPFEIVLTPDSQRKDASGLVINPEGQRIYGSSGLSLTSKYPESSLYGVKSLLGLPFHDLRVSLYQETHPGVNLVPTDRKTVGFNISGTVIPVEEVAAMQIIDAKQRATVMVQEKTHSKDAVLRDISLSVPGNFGSSQRQAIIDAVNLAGGDLTGLTSDGVAVAINYANSPAVSSKLSTDKHYVVVYDVGASAASSTLVSLSVSPEDEGLLDVNVEGYGSSIELSGQALTTLLREMLLERFSQKHGKVTRTPRLLNRLWREAERAKQVLSANTEVHVHIESLANDEDLNTKITREEFENEANFQVQKVAEVLRTSLNDFEGEIDAVVLVGGATRTPFVLDQLKAEVGEAKISKNVNADEANVQGTSMRGVNLKGIFRSKRKFEVSDIVSHEYTLHIASSDGKDTKELFHVGSPLGSKATIDLPRNVKSLEIYEDRKKLVTWDLPYLKQNIDSLHEPGPYTCIDKSRLEATFIIDMNGVLRLVSVDAICNSVMSKSSSTTGEAAAKSSETTSSSLADTTTPSVSQSADTSETTTPTSVSSTDSSSETSTDAEKTHPKTRRVSAQVSWEQAPIGTSERANIRAHLDKMNKNDEDHKHYSVLHHELEILAYRIKGLVSEGKHELASTAEKLLSWIESSTGSLDDLKKNLDEAREAYRGTTEPSASASDTEEEEPSATDTTDDKITHEEL